jgi:hypothetical protein
VHRKKLVFLRHRSIVCCTFLVFQIGRRIQHPNRDSRRPPSPTAVSSRPGCVAPRATARRDTAERSPRIQGRAPTALTTRQGRPQVLTTQECFTPRKGLTLGTTFELRRAHFPHSLRTCASTGRRIWRRSRISCRGKRKKLLAGLKGLTLYADLSMKTTMMKVMLIGNRLHQNLPLPPPPTPTPTPCCCGSGCE